MKVSFSQPARIFVVALSAAAVIVAVQDLLVDRIPYIEPQVAALEPRHDRELDLFVEQSTLLTTLTTGIFAALGAVVLNSKQQALRRWELVPFTIAVTLAGLSLYFGYGAYEEAMWMLRVQTFNLDSPIVLWQRRLQFYTFLASTLCGLYFVLARVGRTN